jgi:Ran-binding protein 1
MSEVVSTKVTSPTVELSKSPDESRERSDSQSEEAPTSPDIEFKPVVSLDTLPVVETKTLEEDEQELFKQRAKLYRFEKTDDGSEWKERGVGEIKILKHAKTSAIRILMRRDKTLKICANHYITPIMKLSHHNDNDKTWTWATMSDFADEEPKAETLCIRFKLPESATKFSDVFEVAKKEAAEQMSAGLAEELNRVILEETSDEEDSDEESETEEDREVNSKENEDDEDKENREDDKPESEQNTPVNGTS